ncbi:MAG: hypothetical protein H0X47_17470 [Nitrospirales bacterium]|nr:hypothetical protein [Nitrospirales bacterium]
MREATRRGITLRQSYTRMAAHAFLQHGRYAKAKQMKRARRMQKKRKVYWGRVFRDLQRKLAADPTHRHACQAPFDRIERVLTQQRRDKQKLRGGPRNSDRVLGYNL